MTLRVFILDDQKPIRGALREAGGRFYSLGDRMLPPEDPEPVIVSLVRSTDDAHDVIRLSEKFDAWLIDRQLRMGDGTGEEFVAHMLQAYPNKVPDEVRSCSASSDGKKALDAVLATRKAS